MGLPEDMLISISGQSRVPPGFRFHPTEEELLQYYLNKRVLSDPIDLDVIPYIDLNKLEPWDIQEKCKIGSAPQNEWYFYTHKDKKYPTGTRTNRATIAGFWKATGRDKVIYTCSARIGMRKTLVFYKGRAPHGQKSEWIMHEYRLINGKINSKVLDGNGEASHEEGWVVCRVFKKKHHLKFVVAKSPSTNNNNKNNNNNNNNINNNNNNNIIMDEWLTPSSEEGTLEQMIGYVGKKTEKDDDGSIQVKCGELFNGTFTKLPSIEEMPNSVTNSIYEPDSCTDWAAFDRLIASHLNGLRESTSHAHLPCFW